MSTPIENVNVSRSFEQTEVFSLVASKDVRLDAFEFYWGLSRGYLNQYYEHPSNFLQVQPAFKQALIREDIALMPTVDMIAEIFKHHESNRLGPANQRRRFCESMPFGEYTFHIVALKPDVSISTKRGPRRVTTKKLKLKPLQGPLISTQAHPVFVLSHFALILMGHYELLGTELFDSLRFISDWYLAPPIAFYDGAYQGDFGRSIPRLYRAQFTYPPPKEPEATELTSCSSESSLSYSDGSERSSKRPRLSSDVDEPDVARWVTNCDPGDVASLEVEDPLLTGYRQETSRSAEDVLKSLPERTPAASPNSISLPTATTSSKRRRNVW